MQQRVAARPDLRPRRLAPRSLSLPLLSLGCCRLRGEHVCMQQRGSGVGRRRGLRVLLQVQQRRDCPLRCGRCGMGRGSTRLWLHSTEAETERQRETERDREMS
jgi:hypothetical protein